LLKEIKDISFSMDWNSNYEDGLNAIAQNRHDVYLVDYHLGDKTGLELLQEVIKQGCRAPLILLTGQGDRRIDLDAIEIGAADYLDKNGINAGLLERSIRYSIERKKLILKLQDALDKIKDLKRPGAHLRQL